MIAARLRPSRHRKRKPISANTGFSREVQVGPNLYAGYYAKGLGWDPAGLGGLLITGSGPSGEGGCWSNSAGGWLSLWGGLFWGGKSGLHLSGDASASHSSTNLLAKEGEKFSGKTYSVQEGETSTGNLILGGMGNALSGGLTLTNADSRDELPKGGITLHVVWVSIKLGISENSKSIGVEGGAGMGLGVNLFFERR